MDLMPSEKMQVLADSPSLFKAEALSRLSVEVIEEGSKESDQEE